MEFTLTTFATIVSIINLIITVVLGFLIYQFSVKSRRIAFESEIKNTIQSLNLAAISGEPIGDYLAKYDIENYNLSGSQSLDIYYVYFELNLIRSMVSAREAGVADAKFYSEALEERVWRLLPYRGLVELMHSKKKNYSSSFLGLVLSMMDRLPTEHINKGTPERV